MRAVIALVIAVLWAAPLPAVLAHSEDHAVSSPEDGPAAHPAAPALSHSRSAGASAEPADAALPSDEKTVTEGADEPAPVLDVSALKSLADVIDDVAHKRIVYVGESHDQHAHHVVQLEVIKGLHERNTTLAIGMEMFQRPFQAALDDYISGKIDERQFLKKSEYFKRWVFDYDLYKPILDYARAQKIPVIALNVRREIIQKVSQGGLESLSEEDRKEIPSDIDLSDKEYRSRLEEFYRTHPSSKSGDFEFFYQSQILWDEAMAQSVDDFFRENPTFLAEGQMVVLAGSGHLMYGSGIPKRAHRRNALDYGIVLNQVPLSRGVADFVVYPKAMKTSPPPKLMVLLAQEGSAVIITGFPEESISARAGLKERDRIVSLDGEPIDTIEDVRIHLLFKKKGDTVRVRAMRKGFLFGEKEKTFDVVL